MIIDLSFRDLFGPAATQTATTFTIAKSDLPTLTPGPDNNGQELLVGILLRLWQLTTGNVTSPGGDTIESPTGQTLTYMQEVNRPTLQLWRVVPTPTTREIIFEVFVWS